jgi:hypothetical protein
VTHHLPATHPLPGLIVASMQSICCSNYATLRLKTLRSTPERPITSRSWLRLEENKTVARHAQGTFRHHPWPRFKAHMHVVTMERCVGHHAC